MLKQLGKYEIHGVLGHGAMGEVYLAQHPAIGREVAIKTILPALASGADAEERFRREATAAGKLNHPNIVTIYDFDRDGDLLFLVMELVKGEDLDAIISEQSLTPSLYLEVLAQVCDGLDYAHRNGVIHRDIKPSNIRVARDGKRLVAKVMDFGIARMQDSNMTGTGIVMGTVSYMAPEYIRSGRSSPQGDLWAVGVMLYECLAAQKPFGGDNTTTVLFKIVSEEPLPIDPGVIRGISPAIQTVLNCALSKDPAHRFKSAEAFARSLRACQDPTWQGAFDGTDLLSPTQSSLNPTERLATSKPQVPPPVVQPPQQQSATGLLAVVGTLLLTLGGAGAYFLLRNREPAPATPRAESAPSALQGTASPAAPSATPREPLAVNTSAAVAAPKTEPPKPTTPIPETPAPGPSPRTTEAPADPLTQALALIPTDAAKAVRILHGLASAQPGDAHIQGSLLGALYRLGNAADFERSLDEAKAAGLSGPQMMKAAPVFRAAMADELRAHKAKDRSNLLSLATVTKIVN